MDTKKLKQIGFTAAVALGAVLLLNTLAKHSTAAAGVASKVNNGL